MPAIHSVVLAGVYDIRSIRKKIRPDEEHQENFPWNIATDFDIDMTFSEDDISGMLTGYENDYHTGMDIGGMSEAIFAYTSGYLVLVSRICKLLDEKIPGTDEFPDRSSAWTKKGFDEAIKRVIKEDNPLYESMLGKLSLYPQLKAFIQELLFNGKPFPYIGDYPVHQRCGYVRFYPQ
ncbi:MAG: hypothetical protein LUF35_08700 [Lachnospiraceae bacterium]|nr:hypothetical protein [Lachnospiraceae bacterium]